ncbi:MAG: hypothetical protein GF372_03290 [Candidatus Marinimicrobia bacterium]|nr:hypothetical protein [Candidatus Neomarinimicrobiota bacterium]
MADSKRVDDILSSGWRALRTGEQYAERLSEAGVDENVLRTLEDYLLALELVEKKQSSEQTAPLTSRIRELLEGCYGWGVKLRLRMETAYGRNSEQFQAFPSLLLSKGRRHLSVMTEAMETMLELAKKYHGMLQEHGQCDAEIIFGENLQKRLSELHKKARLLQESSGPEQKRELVQKIENSAMDIKKAGESLFENQPEVQKKFQKIDPKSTP